MHVAFIGPTIGKKIIMGVTGLIGIGFVIVHMAGNLQAFVGPDEDQRYGALLHGPLAELTWLLRIMLIVAVMLHVLDGVSADTHVDARRVRSATSSDEPQVGDARVANDAVGRRAAARLHRRAHPAFHDRARSIRPAGAG